MINRHDLTQLERDAAKEGAWQAKLAYALYLLKHDIAQKERAKNYLEAVIGANVREYANEAKLSYEKHFKEPNEIKRRALERELDDKVASFGALGKLLATNPLNSPEAQYKTARFLYDNQNKTKEQI